MGGRNDTGTYRRVLFVALSSRSMIGRYDTYRRVVCVVVRGSVVEIMCPDLHSSVRNIDPDEPANINFCLASDRAQAVPQSFCLNDVARINI